MGVKNKLKEIRMREYCMNQKEFADLINVDNKTYSNWEKGTSKPPLEKALEVAEKLNKSVQEIWYLDK